MSAFRTILILVHRYLGIVLSLAFLLWFLSGFVIIYTGGMPQISEAERLQRLPTIDLAAVEVSVAQAQAIAATETLPTLTTVMGAPAYRFDRSATVFADSGRLLTTSQVGSQQIAADYLGIDVQAVHRLGTIEEVDQWTIGLRSALPMEKFAADDGQRSEIYVSRARAQVLLHTTSQDRLLAWLGAIPHWFYIVPLRRDAALWTSVVVWTASLATTMALMGLVLLAWRLRWRRLPNLAAALTDKGIMRWHTLTGMLFGVFVITWAFSGLLSMEPYRWNRETGLALDMTRYRSEVASAAQFDSVFSAQQWAALQLAVGGSDIKELHFRTLFGEPYLEAAVSSSRSPWGHELARLAVDANFTDLDLIDPEQVVTRLAYSVDAELAGFEVLDRYDNYYYGRESHSRPAPPLPVLKARFGDPAQTIFYIDLNTGELVYRSHRWNRLERWLYRGLHSFDFGAFYRMRPLWDLVVILLLAGGLAVSVFGTVLGYRRLKGMGSG
jgi:hypothetical protein